jgi:energy-coupling factor transport system permease protein
MVAVTATTMCALHPVFASISLAGALAAAAAIEGRSVLGPLRWQLPFLCLVCLANPLFSHRGDTLLAQWGAISIHLESVVFGLCMGMLLLASLLWLWLAGRLLSLDRLLSLGSGIMPTVGLMASMVMRLVPQIVSRGSRVGAVRAACSAAGGSKGAVRDGARVSGILLSWSLEDSLERSDAMRARGWRAGAQRTQYLPWSLSLRDVVALVLLIAWAALDAFLEWIACSQWQFYPVMPHLKVWWGYFPHVALVVLPLLFALVDRAKWTHARRVSCR